MKNKKLIDYTWAANPHKLQRAIIKAKEEVNTSGGELSEDLVQSWYVKLGGLVLSTERKIRKNVAEISPEDTENKEA